MAKTDMPTSEILRNAAANASFSERKAMEVEREVVDLYRAFFMRDRVGDILEASVSGVTSFGVFVVADDPFVEGLVRTDYLSPDDFYEYDEVACRLTGRRTGKTFSLGDRVKVEVLQVSVARRRIEMRLQGEGGRAQAGKRDRRDRRQDKPKSKSTSTSKKDRSERRRDLRKKNERRRKK